MPAICSEMVIDPRNEDIIVQAGGCAEDVTGIIDQVKHGRINSDMTRIQVLELRRIEGGSPAAYVCIAKDTLAERWCRNNALGALLLTLAGPLIVGEEKQPVLLKRPAHRDAKDIAI